MPGGDVEAPLWSPHLRAFGCDQIAVTASICERRTPPPSFFFRFRKRTKLN
jgi:hypothetical protein